MPFGSGRQVATSRPHYFEGGVGFGSLVDVLAAIADVRLWSSAFVQTFRRTCQAKAASTARACEDCGARFISGLKYAIQSGQHSCDRLFDDFLALRRHSSPCTACARGMRIQGNGEVHSLVMCLLTNVESGEAST